jgi:hypothetical protein
MVLRVAQFFDLTMYDSQGRRTGRHRYQNYFVGEKKKLGGQDFAFAPFRMEGTNASLNGENSLVQVLFPAEDYVLRLLEQGNGNRLSVLIFVSRWLNDNNQFISNKDHKETFIGIGASFSETTVELRFRSAMDSVGSQFPRRIFSKSLVGILPTSADIALQ